MRSGIFFLVLATSIALNACNSNNDTSDNANSVPPVAVVATAEGTIKGEDIFIQKCAACHGSDGTAGIGNAANLQTSRLDSVSSAKIIADGKGSMPPFKEQLTKEEITSLLGYILLLRK